VSLKDKDNTQWSDDSSADKEYSFNIRKATITITANDKSAYVDDTVPALSESDYTVTGLVNGETLKTLPIIAYAETPNMRVPGTVAIVVSGAKVPEGDNYNEIEYVNGTLTIDRRPGTGGGGVTPITFPTKVKSGDTVTSENLNHLIDSGNSLTVEADDGAKLVFNVEALSSIARQISVGFKVELKDVTDEYQNAHSGKAVCSLTIDADGTTITNFSGKVTVTLPYVLKDDEKAEDVKVWCMASDGTMTEIPCTYDAVEQVVTFTANKTSHFIVGVTSPVAWVNPFTDVSEENWFYDAVAFVNQKGLFIGTSDTTFSPNSPMTRAMIWTVLGRMDGQPIFGSDVFAAARTWAMDAGITDGTNPEANITREQLVTMLWRYAGLPKSKGNLSRFADARSVSGYAVDAMTWAVENGIIIGNNGRLMPKSNATRAEVAAIMQRFIENILE